jgi:hypothetical protein
MTGYPVKTWKSTNVADTPEIIGAAMEVHKFLGNGFQEVRCQRSQAINYLEAFNLEVCLLINFGSKSLKFKRLLNTKYKPTAP